MAQCQIVKYNCCKTKVKSVREFHYSIRNVSKIEEESEDWGVLTVGGNLLFILRRMPPYPTTKCDHGLLLSGQHAAFSKIIIISFRLYPADSMVGSRNLVLRHSVAHFPLNFPKHYALSGRTLRRTFASVPE